MSPIYFSHQGLSVRHVLVECDKELVLYLKVWRVVQITPYYILSCYRSSRLVGIILKRWRVKSCSIFVPPFFTLLSKSHVNISNCNFQLVLGKTAFQVTNRSFPFPKVGQRVQAHQLRQVPQVSVGQEQPLRQLPGCILEPVS